MTKKHFLQAFRISVPVMFGYLAAGFAFGLMLTDRQYPVWLAPVMSVFVYAGAGQYIAVGLFAAGAPLGMIAVTELLVNIRHIVYGLSLISKFRDTGGWKPYLIFALTDETYSLLVSADAPEGAERGAFYGTIALLDQLYWVAGSTAGAVAGALIQTKTNFSLDGIDFALTGLFAVLLIDQIEKTGDFLPPAAGALCALAGIILWRCGILPDGNDIPLLAIAAGLAVLLAVRRPGRNSGEGAE